MREGSYHFSCGDSTHGPVGLCGSVLARANPEALRKIKKALTDVTRPYGEIPAHRADHTFEYLNFYATPENIKLEEVDIWRQESRSQFAVAFN